MSGILQRQLTISSEEEPPQSWRRRQPKTGLGQTNNVNIVDATAALSHTKVVLYIPLT